MRLSGIKIIKIDVEGFEDAVLRGVSELITTRIADYIICELSYDETRQPAIEMFKRFGYEARALARQDGTTQRQIGTGCFVCP